MKKIALIVFALVCLVIITTQAEPDHSNIELRDETIYVFLPSIRYKSYHAQYCCLVTNKSSSNYYHFEMNVELLDKNNNVVCVLSPSGYIVLKPGETRAVHMHCLNISTEQRSRIASYNVRWESCEEITKEIYKIQRVVDLPYQNLKVTDGQYYREYTCTITNPFDQAILASGIYGQIEFYDKTDGHLVYCDDYYDMSLEARNSTAGIRPGYSVDNWLAQIHIGIIEIIGTDYDVKLHIEYQYNNSFVREFDLERIEYYIGTKN